MSSAALCGATKSVCVSLTIADFMARLVCDEPTAALDADTGQTVVQILKQVAFAPDRAVIVVTHDTRIFRFADNIARMEDGRIGSMRSAAHGELAEVA